MTDYRKIEIDYLIPANLFIVAYILTYLNSTGKMQCVDMKLRGRIFSQHLIGGIYLIFANILHIFA